MPKSNQSIQIIKVGRLLYGLGIAAIGVHQLIIKKFRPEILPPFPDWAHSSAIFPIIAGLSLLISGIIISGLIPVKPVVRKVAALYLGFAFLVIIICCHLPYILFVSPISVWRIDVWFGLGEALAYGGGAFVMAGSFPVINEDGSNKKAFSRWLQRLVPAGSIFFALLIILFGSSHFVFTKSVSAMVPKFFGVPLFWTYFVGAALIATGIAIIARIWAKQAAFLLAFMLFLFFIFFHVPDAIANPSVGGGNEIVRAIVALLFCGIALVTASTVERTNNIQ